jgi:4-hydroxy-tetrahydrodipicolinate synthase
MSASIKRSAFVTSITPFTPSGAIDEDAYRAHLQRLAGAGIGVYVGGSGSGEGYTMSRSEMATVLSIAADELKGKVPVRAMGVEPRTPSEMIEFLALARDCGVDGAQVYSLDIGHDLTLTPEEIEAYMVAVLEASDLPLIFSTHFSVGYQFPFPLVSRLIDDYPRFVGINCTHPDLFYLSELIRMVGKRVAVMVGGPMQALTALALGGHGYIAADGNIAPRLCVSIIELYEAGDLPGLMDAFGKLIKLFGVSLDSGGTRVVKPALNRLGFNAGTVRPPRQAIEDERLARVLNTVTELGIAAIEGW